MCRQFGLRTPVSITILHYTVPFQLPVSYQKHLIARMVFAAVERILWSCMIIQVKRDLRKSLVKPPPQSTISYEIRPDYSDIFP